MQSWQNQSWQCGSGLQAILALCTAQTHARSLVMHSCPRKGKPYTQSLSASLGGTPRASISHHWLQKAPAEVRQRKLRKPKRECQFHILTSCTSNMATCVHEQGSTHILATLNTEKDHLCV